MASWYLVTWDINDISFYADDDEEGLVGRFARFLLHYFNTSSARLSEVGRLHLYPPTEYVSRFSFMFRYTSLTYLRSE